LHGKDAVHGAVATAAKRVYESTSVGEKHDSCIRTNYRNHSAMPVPALVAVDGQLTDVSFTLMKFAAACRE
jgi:hypothetical protein